MSHDFFVAIALWMSTLWNTLKHALYFHTPMDEPDLFMLPLRMGRLQESIDLRYPLIPRGQHNTALLALMKTIEAEIAIRQNPPQSISSDFTWEEVQAIQQQEHPAYDVPSVTYDNL